MKFIYGDEPYLINREIKKQTHGFDAFAQVYGEDTDIEDIIMDIDVIGLFSELKVIVVKDHPMFSDNDLAKRILPSLRKIGDSVKLFFTYETKRMDKKNPLIKFLLDNTESKEFKKLAPQDIVPTIKDIVNSKGGKISNSAAIKFSTKVPNDLRIIVRELEKLLLETNEITDKQIEVSIGDYLKDDFFALSNAIVSKDTYSIISTYQDRIALGEDAPTIIPQISSVFNLAALVASHKKQGYTNQEISDKTKIHIFRVKKSSELISMISPEQLDKLIITLADLEKGIKTGRINKDKGLEMYLLNLIK